MKPPRTVGIDTLRARLHERVGAAQADGQHTIVTSYRKPVAVLVPYVWYVEQAGADTTTTEETAP